ncbi:MAG: hypothetical protein EDS66_03780 [Planctomycetota bacterium]|nr:MAG: hypothetical protein EDS66_03780 [Planctomycetota bacterium]
MRRRASTTPRVKSSSRSFPATRICATGRGSNATGNTSRTRPTVASGTSTSPTPGSTGRTISSASSTASGDGTDWTWPPDSHQGPKCMLINGLAGSGGDMFPALFRQSGLGKLIGMRTWGGLVGISGNPQLIDGGNITAPTFAFYERDGTWGIEGHGVDPDLEVIDDPAKMADGGDPQLDAAIAHLLEELQRNPYVKPARPAYPDRSGMGIREEDK